VKKSPIIRLDGAEITRYSRGPGQLGSNGAIVASRELSVREEIIVWRPCHKEAMVNNLWLWFVRSAPGAAQKRIPL
jgi:hypothetical protein